MRTIWRRSWNLRSGWTAALRTSACHKRNIFGWMGLKASHIPGNNNAQGFGANPVSRWSQPLFPVCTVDGYHIFYHFNYVTIRRVMASYVYCGFRVSVGMRSWNRWRFNEKGRSLPTGLVFGGGAKGHPLSFPENLDISTFSRFPRIPRPRQRPHLERTDTLTNARSRKPQGLVDPKSYDRRRTPEQRRGTVLNRAPRLLHDNASSHLP